MSRNQKEKTKETGRPTYTPMMEHYLSLKEENPDAILMYRLGDFYEMFFDDAKIASRELDLVLTGRAAGAEKAPMCGVPHHAVNAYIARLVKKGYKVAVCEQLEDPSQAKGLVERGIVRIVTPGTWMDEQVDSKSLNYMAVIASSSWNAAILYCDLSTGRLLYEITERSVTEILRALSAMNVSEVVFARTLDKSLARALQSREEWICSVQKPAELQPADENLLAIREGALPEALGVLMGYLDRTQCRHVEHLSPMEPVHPPKTMVMDTETRRHLELTSTASASSRAVSLWQFMDLCKSSMGSRLLKTWIEAPLLDLDHIRKRQDGVEQLSDQFLLREQLKDHLAFIYDMERLASRISYGSASPRDVLQLITSLEHARPILELAAEIEAYPEFQQTPDGQDLYETLKGAIVSDPPLTLKDGNVIAPGYDEELDRIRLLADRSSDAILALETREKERTGIRALKVGYNRVFGYYIEVRNGSLQQVKAEFGYTPKQTLANTTRYITQELKELEDQILNAQDQKIRREQELFSGLLERIRQKLADLHALSQTLAAVDVLCALAQLASDRGYVRPVLQEAREVEVLEGRHPILDARLSGYVSNDWIMKPEDHVELITGPNMGGKSTYLRQNALLVIMAQAGSFIPARQAVLPVFDRIFTRIGASDDILTGKSTFMVEMMEANAALRYATRNSLILFDEIGRGTATYDGMALAQAMVEYLDEAIQAKALFSTHYHELTALEEQRAGIFNVHVDVKEKKDEISFLYRVAPGRADKSYGINVARLAKLPGVVIERAASLLEGLEKDSSREKWAPSLFIMETVQPERTQLIEKLKDLNLDDMTPREAWDVLDECRKLAEKVEE